MLKVLVTGSNGFTGKYLIPELISAGYDVIDIKKALKGRDFNLLDPLSIKDVIVADAPDYVIHLAAISFVQHDDTTEIYNTNVIGTCNLLCAIRNHLPDVKNVLIASSANIYGAKTEGPIVESALFSPENHYAASKAAMEMSINVFRHEIPITIVRPFNYTGVGQDVNFLVPKIVSHFQKNSPSIELGNTDISRDFSDVRDVVKAYTKLLTSKDASGGTFNICSGQSISISEILSYLNILAGYQIDVRVNPQFMRSNDIKDLWGDNSKIRKCINFKSTPFKETIEWMYKNQP